MNNFWVRAIIAGVRRIGDARAHDHAYGAEYGIYIMESGIAVGC